MFKNFLRLVFTAIALFVFGYTVTLIVYDFSLFKLSASIIKLVVMLLIFDVLAFACILHYDKDKSLDAEFCDVKNVSLHGMFFYGITAVVAYAIFFLLTYMSPTHIAENSIYVKQACDTAMMSQFQTVMFMSMPVWYLTDMLRSYLEVTDLHNQCIPAILFLLISTMNTVKYLRTVKYRNLLLRKVDTNAHF